MKMVKRAIQGLALGACALAAVPAAHAKAQPGFYMGLSAVKSTFDLDKEEFDDLVIDTFYSVGAPVISGSSTFEDSDTAVSFFAGYRFAPYIAIELGYLDLGAAEYRSTGTVNPPGPVTSAPATVGIDIATKGFTLSGIGSIPIGEVFDLHGRLGFLVAETELTVDMAIGSSSASESDSLDSTNVYFGLGAGFHLGDHWSLSLDWTKYANVGDEDEDEDYETEAGFDVDTLSFSAMYKF